MENNFILDNGVGIYNIFICVIPRDSKDQKRQVKRKANRGRLSIKRENNVIKNKYIIK